MLEIGEWDGFFSLEAERRGGGHDHHVGVDRWLSGHAKGGRVEPASTGCGLVKSVAIELDAVVPSTTGG